ncbi:MAG: hypothetical protein EZS28_039787 [Streblomastix strix]|uniref:Cyclin N-terminal domain-containing protein n=1 Tax=Streblomastix strix TaxID=222440 RepID=A0A5J4U1T8_9EUKA|nr:MAG: hypothetical protein EZS28_039787 [Streblomastix strix]
MNNDRSITDRHQYVTKTLLSQGPLMQIIQNPNYLPTAEQILILSKYLANTVQSGVEGSLNIITVENVKVLLEFVQLRSPLTLGELLTALHVLETLLRKCRQKNDNTVSAENFGTALVCIFIVTLKFLRDIPYRNSWWAQKFNMNLQTINESEVVILQLMDWQMWMSDKSFIRFYSRVFRL